MKDHETETIRWVQYRRLSEATRAVMIAKVGDQFEVHDHSPDGVAPVSVYPSAREAAARALQLLKTGPVAPQTWPETACIGHITTDESA